MRKLLIGGVVVLTVLTFYSALWFKSEAIETDIQTRVAEALSVQGAEGIDVAVDGRHVTLAGLVYSDTAEIELLKAAASTEGVLGPIDGLTLTSQPGLSIIKSEDGIILRGLVPDEETKAALLAAAAGAEIEDQTQIGGVKGAWHDEAAFVLGQMPALSTGTVFLDENGYVLSGMASDGLEPIDAAFGSRDGWQTLVAPADRSEALAERISQLETDLAETTASQADREAEVSLRDEQIAGLESDLADLESA
ncbi:MAG: BON domain-containing protein, partial [Pseudomonadota bacterium]